MGDYKYRRFNDACSHFGTSGSSETSEEDSMTVLTGSEAEYLNWGSMEEESYYEALTLRL